jgi:hypothetical protein
MSPPAATTFFLKEKIGKCTGIVDTSPSFAAEVKKTIRQGALLFKILAGKMVS